MRFHHHLLASFVPSALLLLSAANARATQPSPQANDEASFGTTPARSKGQMQQQSAPTPVRPASPQQSLPVAGSDGPSVQTADEPAIAYDSDEMRQGIAPIATDPPGDWAVLHAGLRPKIATFGGIATFALAHARTESFYGGFSLSAVRNDAGTHVGLAQIALGRNLSDSFAGGYQLSITENRARSFVGLGQTALAYNRALDIKAVTQLAIFNRAKSFTGVAQLGAYNRTDASFAGATQLGAFNHSRGDFVGLVQLGAVNATGRQVFGDKNNAGNNSFSGVAQVGLVNTAHGNFYGLAQVGAAAFTSNDFRGLVQVGALGAGAGSFKGLAQLGLVSVARESVGLQIGGGAISLEEHTGIQIGALGTYAKKVDGAQVGVANLAEHVRGVQIGVFNHAKSLRGMQIGLANHADDGVLPWTALLNFGFGDDESDTQRDYDQQRKAQGRNNARRRPSGL